MTIVEGLRYCDDVELLVVDPIFISYCITAVRRNVPIKVFGHYRFIIKFEERAGSKHWATVRHTGPQTCSCRVRRKIMEV